MTKHKYARSPRGRMEHLTADSKTTLCGKDCKGGAMVKYDKNPSYQDSKVRPLCPGCRAKKGK